MVRLRLSQTDWALVCKCWRIFIISVRSVSLGNRPETTHQSDEASGGSSVPDLCIRLLYNLGLSSQAQHPISGKFPVVSIRRWSRDESDVIIQLMSSILGVCSESRAVWREFLDVYKQQYYWWFIIGLNQTGLISGETKLRLHSFDEELIKIAFLLSA